ncbi:hypothetical protein BJ166DRAFT_267942 [Pestalotiopsis sp. NC0098]|nr:hypothetical protein BJ166DRAFT_267942 [Pestalotiopsis sp. NC0098]
MTEFANKLSTAFDTHFAKYAGDQVHLWLLTTHPDYRRRGAARALCCWGMQLAQSRNHPVTVLASPMGRQLYTNIGFRTVGAVVVQVPGEEQRLEVFCLEKKPQLQVAAGRGVCMIL